MRIINLTILILALTISLSFAQNEVPKEASSIIGLSLDDAENSLEKNGYEIAFSSIFGKKQYWWSDSKKTCVNVAFHKGKKHIIESVTLLDESECLPGIEASHKIWEKYHDGQAPMNSSEVTKQREKLTTKGYKASYWIHEISLGHDIEYWYNEKTNKCKYIVWNTSGGDGVYTGNGTPEQAKNPAPPSK